MTITTRAKSPSRAEASAKAMTPGPVFNTGVLLGNWVEDRIECPKGGTFYFPPKEVLDYEKLKPELRLPDFRQNKLNGLQGNVCTVIRQDSHDSCGNYATTTDLVYNHLPKPLCGPELRYYKRSAHHFYPQPDLMKCFGNATEWGLRKYLQHEWACTDVSDYSSTLYEDTYVPPLPHQYLQRCERKARNSKLSLATVNENIVRKPAHLRVLHKILEEHGNHQPTGKPTECIATDISQREHWLTYGNRMNNFLNIGLRFMVGFTIVFHKYNNAMRSINRIQSSGGVTYD